jgi:hypothetical protein
VQALSVGASAVEPVWRLALEGWEAATHVQLAADEAGVSAAAILYK